MSQKVKYKYKPEEKCAYRNWLWLVEHVPFDVQFPFDFALDPFVADDSNKVAWKKYTAACLQSTTLYYKVPHGTTPYYKVLLQYYNVLLRTKKYESVW